MIHDRELGFVHKFYSEPLAWVLLPIRTTPAHPVAAPHLQPSGLKYQESKSVSFRCRLVAFAELPYSSMLRQLVHRPVLKPLSLYHDVDCAVPASSSIGPAQ